MALSVLGVLSVLFCLLFLFLLLRKIRALVRIQHGADTEGQLQVDSWNLRHQDTESALPLVSTKWPKEAHRPVFLFSTVCNISMQAWLTYPYFIFN